MQISADIFSFAQPQLCLQRVFWHLKEWNGCYRWCMEQRKKYFGLNCDRYTMLKGTALLVL